jgi:diacylglycerol kinase (ATP)
VKGSRARLILNPAAGADEGLAHAQMLNERLSSIYGPIEIVVTSGPGDGEEAGRRAVEDGCEVVFVAGGDGTLNEALNGVGSIEGALARTVFGVIPLGTGNDFAQALGLPPDVGEAVDVLASGRTLDVDVGRVNGRFFVNISGGGFIAEVSDAVTPRMKSIAGRLAYLLGGAQALLEFEPVRMTLDSEPAGERLDIATYAFAACNSRLIGGGKLIAPHAAIDDGLLDFCVIEAMPALEFVALLRRVAAGEHMDDPRVHYRQASHALLQFDRPILVNTDGEILEADRCEYSVMPSAARFLAAEAPFAGSTPERTFASNRKHPGATSS